MNRILSLSRAEQRWEAALPEGVRLQPLLRALMAMVDADPTLMARAIEGVHQGRRIEDDVEEGMPGRQVGHSVEEYAAALREADSVSAAARALGVHRATVYEMIERHRLPRPTRRRRR